VTAEEELARVLPVIRGLARRVPSLPISIDTTKAAVAREAVGAGAAIINDVSGLRFDPELADVARRARTPLILMHLHGRPETMQRGPFARSLWRSVISGLERSARSAREHGVWRSQLLIDPGLGFGKSRRQNFELLLGLERLRGFRLPLLVGASRKSFVQAIAAGEGLELARHAGRRRSPWRLLAAGRRTAPGLPPALLAADAAAVATAILGGAHVVRVHDVAQLLPAVRFADAVLQSAP
jgi:dihydropteroate synthase